MQKGTRSIKRLIAIIEIAKVKNIYVHLRFPGLKEQF